LAAGGNRNPAVISVLLQARAGVDERDRYGLTPLMYASCYNPNPEVIATLLRAGADPNARDRNGLTPLMLAARSNQNPEVTTVLLESGGDAKARDNDGKTAFDWVRNNERLKGTDAYQKLKEAQY